MKKKLYRASRENSPFIGRNLATLVFPYAVFPSRAGAGDPINPVTNAQKCRAGHYPDVTSQDPGICA